MQHPVVATTHQRYHIPNLKRALEVFEVLAKNTDGITLSEIARITGYSKNSIFRIICTLEDCGYVLKNKDHRKIRMSRKLAALGYAAFGESNIVERAMDVLRKMRDDLAETAMLGTMLEEDCVLLEQAPGRYPFKFLGEVGMRICFNASASGKAMLAFLPKEELDRRISAMKFKKFNPRTILDKKSFLAELEKVRAKGYSVDNGEEIEGVNCVGAPIFDAHGYPIASIWITGPGERIKESQFDEIGAKVRSYADIISVRLGYGLI